MKKQDYKKVAISCGIDRPQDIYMGTWYLLPTIMITGCCGYFSPRLEIVFKWLCLSIDIIIHPKN